MSLRNSSTVGGWGDSDSDDDVDVDGYPNQQEEEQYNDGTGVDTNVDEIAEPEYENYNGQTISEGVDNKVDASDADTEEEDDDPVAEAEEEEETEEERQRRIAEAKKLAQEKLEQKKKSKKQSASMKEQLDDLDDILNEFGIAPNATKTEDEKPDQQLGPAEQGDIDGQATGTSKRKKNKKKKNNLTTVNDPDESIAGNTPNGIDGTASSVESIPVTLPTIESQQGNDSIATTPLVSNIDPASVLKAKQQQAASKTSSSSKKSAAQLAAAKELKAAEELKKKKKKKDKNSAQFGR